MYLRRKDAEELIEQLFATSHEEIRKKNKFLGELVRLDDWSFIIKSHALIEAAVSQALTDHIGAPLLTDFFQRLPLSDGQIGKSKLAKQLGLLDSKELKFIRWFSELRNKLVHRIDNLEFDIKQHISGLAKEQKDLAIKTWLWFSKGDLQAHKQWE